MSKRKIRYKPKPHRQLSPAKRKEMKVLNKRLAADRQYQRPSTVAELNIETE